MKNISKLPKKYQYLEDIDISFVNRLGKRKKVGRNGYGKENILRYLLIQKITQYSDRDLEDISGIDYTTFSKARIRFEKENIYEKFLNHLVLAAVKKGIVSCEKIIIDSSFVCTYSKRKEEGSRFWIKNQKIKGYGFKLHTLIDASGIPLALIVTAGSNHDAPLAIPLLKKFERLKISTKYVLADRGYDSEDIVRYIFKEMKAKASIPIRKPFGRESKRTKALSQKKKYEQWKLKSMGRSFKQSIYNKRTEIERFFSKIKRKYNLGKEKTRGISRFKINSYLASICFTLEKLFTMNSTSF
jgi:hypothetical protein